MRQRAGLRLDLIHIQVDLRVIAGDKQAEHDSLRTWARQRLQRDPDEAAVARLSQAVIGELASFIGIDRSEFVQLLVRFTPAFTPRRQIAALGLFS